MGAAYLRKSQLEFSPACYYPSPSTIPWAKIMRNQEPDISLRDIVITDELQRRQERSPNPLAGELALEAIATATPHGHQAILKALCRLALVLCDAGSAGINLLENGAEEKPRFRCIALDGAMAPYQDDIASMDHSICGYVCAQRAPQLLDRSARSYDMIKMLGNPVIEALVAPLYRDVDEIIGTIWVVVHEEGRGFDSEDLRILKLLGSHAAAAMKLHEAAYRFA